MLIFRDSRPAGLQIGCTIARYSGSTVIAVRAALRTLPLISMRGPEIVLSAFRAAAFRIGEGAGFNEFHEASYHA
jgi:hypothetical protein